jgi:hypothetical protein
MISDSDPAPENSQLLSGGCVSSTGKLYQNGGEWQEDPCTTCTCVSGAKKCQAHMCVLRCDHPRYVPDECCPLCDGKACLHCVRLKWQETGEGRMMMSFAVDTLHQILLGWAGHG